MADEPVDVVLRKSRVGDRLVHGLGDLAYCETVDFLAMHEDAAYAALASKDVLVRMASGIRNEEAVRIVLDDQRAGSVSEEDACVAVVHVHDRRKLFASYDQSLLASAALEQRVSSLESIYESRARAVDVDREDAVADAEFSCYTAGYLRRRIYSCERADYNEVYVLGFDAGRPDRHLAGFHGQIVVIFFFCEVSLLDAALRSDPFVSGVYDLRQIFIRYLALTMRVAVTQYFNSCHICSLFFSTSDICL